MLELKNISAGYNGVKVIDNINICFEKGTITSVIGKNGCGKTTLLKTIGNLLKPLSGNIFLDGKSIFDMPNDHIAKRISFLPQSRRVPNVSVYDLVMYGRFPYMQFFRIPKKIDKMIVEDAMERTGIIRYKDRNIQELSGGEQQKVYIAMIIAQNTDVILLDEPTTYLDINHQFEILEIIKGLKEIGKTVIMVLHDLNSAFSYSDKICLMEKGEIVIYDTPQVVFESKEVNRVFKVDCEEVYLKSKMRKQYIFSL